MPTIKSELRENIALLKLDNGKTNAIGPDLVKDLSDALDKMKNEAQGIVLCGNATFFSIGLDLPSLIAWDRTEMTAFWYRFNRLVLDLYTVALPTVCLLSGHAVAGGNILALTGDYRLAATETKKIGLNEIRLGVPVPYLAQLLLQQAVSEAVAKEVLYSGAFISFGEAQAVGLIDAICPLETAMQQAIEKASELAKRPPQAFSAIKACRTGEIKARYEKNHKIQNEIFLDCWFSEPTRGLLQEAARKF